ncbi:hypothetical protein BSL78_27232, partial [Apostichopus japonicus]
DYNFLQSSMMPVLKHLWLIVTMCILHGTKSVFTDCTSHQNARIGSSWKIDCRLQDWSEVKYYHDNPVEGNLLIMSNQDCPDITVYAHHGSDALINCYFPQSQRVFWYDSTSRNARPIASLEGGRKAGTGVTAGKYDITNTCGLLIRNTTFSDEKTYRAIVIVSNIHTLTTDQKVVIYGFRLFYSKRRNSGIFSRCLRGKKLLFGAAARSDIFMCRETNTGPHTLLSWTRNTSNGTRLVNTSKSFDGNMYEAFVSTNVNLNSTDRLYVYICNSIIDIPAKPLRQIVVMVEDESKDYITTLLKPTYYRAYDDVRLVCTNENPLFILWKRNHETIGYYHEGKSDVLKPGYELDKDGSLLINKFSYTQKVNMFVSTTMVKSRKYSNIISRPLRAFFQSCTPKWIHDEYFSSRITFSRPQLIVRNVGSLFNIYLTTYYEITTDQVYESETDEDWQAYDVTASCSVNYEVLGQHKTDVTLHLQKRTSAVTEDRIRKRFGGEETCVNKTSSDGENNYKNNGDDNPALTI